MSARACLPLLCAALAGCGFAPDLSRFGACDEAGQCGEGLTCVLPERRCIPDCLTCESTGVGGDAGADAGEPDAGGADAGEPDAGVVTDAGALWVSAALVRGVEGVFFEERIEVDGGVGPYGFEPLSSSIPGPMSLDGEGVLRGTPAQPGVYLLRARVSDAAEPPLVADASVAWEVHPVLRFAGPALLAEAPANRAYSERVSAHGGVPPYSYSLVSGALSGNIALAADGALSGTAGGMGSGSVTLQVTDSATPPQSVTTVADFVTGSNGLNGLRVLTRGLPTARVGWPYSYQLTAYGGVPPYAWVQTDGVLPAGLTLTSAGLLHGVPTQSGTFALEVELTDEALLLPPTRSSNLSIVVH